MWYVLATVFVASVVLTIFLYHLQFAVVSEVASLPAVAALFAALYQLARDRIAYDRAVQLEEARNFFTIGATSHMANVAFDKHVAFCQEYTDAVNQALHILLRRGPNEVALDEATKLLQVRVKWNVWLPPEIQTDLIKFEGAVRQIGSGAWLLRELGPHPDREETVKKTYGTFAAVMGWGDWRGEPVTQEVAAEKIIAGLQTVLGIKELTRLRTTFVKRAIDDLGD
jgi:hypothetical protein